MAPAAQRRGGRRGILLLALLLVASAVMVSALAVGSVELSVGDLWRILWGEEHGLKSEVVLALRLPRALAAFAAGGLLAVAGALMQILLRNPLADPYILGVSGGAAVGALGAIVLGLGAYWPDTWAFLGALLSMGLVLGLSRSGGAWTPTRLLLTGVVVAAGWGALISLLLSLGQDRTLRGMLFWLLGDVSHVSDPRWALAVLVLGLMLVAPLGRGLNVLARGELAAAALGVAVGPLRLGVYVTASLLTATAVTLAGSIGFVGLVVPHLVRLAAGNDQRRLLPAAALLGGSLLVAADTLARSVAAPSQLPVGVVTALLGVPLFLFLMRRAGAGEY